jgi:glycosyltransferase involved in cell wall biosynthesis
MDDPCRRIRVLIVCDFLFKYASQQARSLVGMGHDVAILCRSHALEFGGDTAERDDWVDGLRQEGITMLVVPGRVRSIAALPRLLEIRRHLKRWRPQVVNVHENHDPRLLALTRGYRTVLTVHDPLGHPGAPDLSRAENWAFRKWFRRSDRFIVHGQALVEELVPLIDGQPIAVIPHGMSARSEPLSRPNSPTVLLFGRLEQYKGVEVLVEAMHRVWKRRSDVRLVVAGSGQASRLVPDDPRISLIDRYIPESDVDGLLAEASLVALPYTQASQSGVGLLAIAAGVPVLVSDLGALPELAYSPSFVVRAGDSNALADAIVHHVDAGEDVRRAVLQHARANFSWEHAARLTTQLYCDLISGY